MSNSEPTAIVLQAIPCMCGLYPSFDSHGETGSQSIPLALPPRNSAFILRGADFLATLGRL